MREYRTDEMWQETTACLFMSKKNEVPDDGVWTALKYVELVN